MECKVVLGKSGRKVLWIELVRESQERFMCSIKTPDAREIIYNQCKPLWCRSYGM
jgi:hypothetical protein